MCKLKSLKELFIARNDKIQNLPETLKDLSNLKKLNVSGCRLRGFPKVLCKLKTLKILDFSRNHQIQNLPQALEGLKNLETLNVSGCGIIEFSQVLGELQFLQKLDISRNPVTKLPGEIERCKCLQQLNISESKIKEFPTFLFKMKNLSIVAAFGTHIEVLEEDFVKFWSQRPDIYTEGRFQKVYGLENLRFVKPPHEIVERGPEACMKYYRALRADNAVNCSLLNVTVMGQIGAGKSSLVQSIKEGSSVIVDPSDRTVVVDTVDVKHEDILLKIADFGGHDIYEMTYPMFLKSTKQAAIVAVKLSEYTENNHDELVTKWLTTAVSNMKRGSICIVATQCDLCTNKEVKEKIRKLKEKLEAWIEEEISFSRKIRTLHQTSISGIWGEKKFYYFQTSSLNMEGIKEVEEFLSHEAKSNRSVLPKRWTNIFKKIDEKTDANFITDTQYQTIFGKDYTLVQVVLKK